MEDKEGGKRDSKVSLIHWFYLTDIFYYCTK